MTTDATKRDYVKPALERIDLAGEETAAVPNCKRSNGGGKNRSSPTRADHRRSAVKCFDARGS